MTSEAFYDIIDQELESIIREHKVYPYFKKNKSDSNNCKSRAFLIWFLKFYGKTENYSEYITDGDGDHCCDIIFDSVDNQENKIYYIVQSKWNVKSNCQSCVNKADVSHAFNEFGVIIRGSKLSTKNENFTRKLNELQEHVKNNGEIKIIYLTLCNPNAEVEDSKNAFLSDHRKTSFEWIDLTRLKIDYINKNYKEIELINPMYKYYNPEEEEIELAIKQFSGGRSFIHIDKPFEAFVFLLKPSVIYELFNKYGFLLFQKNVRNPLLISELNQQIENTIIDNPAYFWYYNNGLTAITYLLPEIRNEAERIKITGLQIINGAQTVYSIYKAYQEASTVKRQVMDTESFVTLRILKSGGKDFDLNVTRFTNLQNPVSDRDFVANDDVQRRLQEESFNTSVWYEKRRGEFRNKKMKGVSVVSNEDFATLYTAYFLHDPVKSAILNSNVKKRYAFISHKEDRNGLYETIFNERTSFNDMLAAYQLEELIVNSFEQELNIFTRRIILLSLFSFVAKDYYKSKYDSKEIDNLSTLINREFDKGKYDESLKILKYIEINTYKVLPDIHKLRPGIAEIENEISHDFKLINSFGYFERIKEELLSKNVTAHDIDSIDIRKEKESYIRYKDKKSKESGEIKV